MRKSGLFILAAAMSISLAACGSAGASAGSTAAGSAVSRTEQAGSASADTSEQTAAVSEQTAENTQPQEAGQSTAQSSAAAGTVTEANVTTGGAIDTTDLFTERDLTQGADLTDAVYMTVTDGEDISITAAGVYVISGTASEVTITVEAQDEDKVQLVLDGVSVTNSSSPCIYVKSADKVFVTTTDSENSLSVTGAFTADGDTNTDAVIFSKEDLVLNGVGTLNISSTDNGITSKDDLKVTGGTLNISCVSDALEANDSIAVADGVINISTQKDGFHAEYDEDDTVGYVYICGGTLNITAGDDGIHATTILQIDGGNLNIDAAECLEATIVQINDGVLNLNAADDGINAARKSGISTPLAEFNGGTVTIVMGAGDTDAVDSNGNLIINGGTLDITAQSPFDYDGTAEYNGGTIIVNGQQIDSITNQFGGMGQMGGMPGGDMGGDMGGGQMGGGPGMGGFPGGGR